ncbi:MAG TPA: 4-hydroxyphenylacetate 3-hydroxylase C-terminal domain-containing protein, partial [Anaeromyxobacteraceae bacterium]
DAKGNRALRASRQPDPDTYLHVKEVRTGGIVVRGVKAQICAVAASNEIVVVPGTACGEAEKQHAVAFAIPRDVDGLTIVETRRPSDARDEEEGWDAPKAGGITQAWLLFDDVFVPSSRVFLCGEHEGAGRFISIFSAIYRAAIGACVAGQGDVMIGAALALARANGLSQKIFQEKLTQMTVNNEVTFGLGAGAIFLGQPHPSGLFVPDPLLAHVNKVQVGRLPYETKVLAQDISGGIAETGCLPSFRDLTSQAYGAVLLKAAAGAVDGETRARLARLVEWLTIGGGVPGCMHGGGSPDGARLAVKGLVDWERCVADARRIAGVARELPDPRA